MADEQKDPHEGFTLEDASLKEREVPPPDPVEAATVEAEAPKAEEPEAERKREDDLPIGAKKRVARAERKADEFERKLEQAQEMIAALKAKKEGKAVDIDPEQFESYEAYAEARRKAEAKGDDAPQVDTEVVEALDDIKEAMATADPALWDRFREVKDGQPVIRGVSRAMVLVLADLVADGEDIAGKLRALADMPEDDRIDMAGMSQRAARRAIRALEPVKAKETKPRDPDTGQFVKQSDAPPPITPVGTGAAPRAPLDKLGFSDFAARRNEAEKSKGDRFGFA